MIPPVTLPANSEIKTPVDFKLKPGWRFDPRRHFFESDSGERFSPGDELPKNSRIVYKVPSLARADPAKLSEAERDLQRYMQVILPEDASPADYVEGIRKWPPVEEAHVAPEVSLPMQARRLQ